MILLKNKSIFILLLILVVTNSLEGQSFSGVRPIGMGNAFVAVADDENTLYFNPAGLSRLNRAYTTVLINAQGIFDKNSLDIYKFLRKERDNIENALSGLVIEDGDFDEKLNELSEIPGEGVLRYRLFESVRKNSGFGLHTELFTRYTLNALDTLNTLDTLKIPVSTSIRSTFTLGYSKNLPYDNENATFAYGISFAYDVTHTLPDSTVIQSPEDYENYFLFRKPDIPQVYKDSKLEQGLRINVGGLYRLPPYHVNIGVTVQNFITTTPKSHDSRMYTIGIAHRPLNFLEINFPKDLVLAMDYVDAFSDEKSFKDKLRLGMEIRIPVLSGRIGLRSGKATYGASVDLGFIHIHYAYASLFNNDFTFTNSSNQHFLEIRIGS